MLLILSLVVACVVVHACSGGDSVVVGVIVVSCHL